MGDKCQGLKGLLTSKIGFSQLGFHCIELSLFFRNYIFKNKPLLTKIHLYNVGIYFSKMGY